MERYSGKETHLALPYFFPWDKWSSGGAMDESRQGSTAGDCFNRHLSLRPVYRGKPWNMKILVVDDGSTDDTVEAGEKIRREDSIFLEAQWRAGFGVQFWFTAGARGDRGVSGCRRLLASGKASADRRCVRATPRAGMYHTLRQYDTQTWVFKDGGLALLSGFLPENAKELLSYVLYPTSFLAFRRRLLEQLLPIPEQLTI
jgi:hypothetical protein